jgi:CelD/BcsL family acetyltransferase involved in cellulose biosynthesis
MLDESVAAAVLITSEALDDFAAEWAALHARIPGATPFTHPAWHQVWLRHFGDACSPTFLSFRLGDELVGAAALDPAGDIARQLGDHNVCDYAGVLALPGHEDAVALGLLEWLMEDLTPILELWGVAGDSALRSAFQAAAPRFGWSYREAQEAVCPGVDLPGDFDSFVASLPKHDRHELRRKLRNFEAAGIVTYEEAVAADEIVPQVDGLLEMMRDSRDAKAEFLTPAMEAFFRDLGGIFGALGMARLATLKLDGTPVARTFSFENATTEFLYNCGFNPEFAHLAVGLASKAYAIRSAISQGKVRFDFLRGDEEYKRRLGGVPLQVYTLTLRQASAPAAGDC